MDVLTELHAISAGFSAFRVADLREGSGAKED